MSACGTFNEFHSFLNPQVMLASLQNLCPRRVPGESPAAWEFHKDRSDFWAWALTAFQGSPDPEQRIQQNQNLNVIKKSEIFSRKTRSKAVRKSRAGRRTTAISVVKGAVNILQSTKRRETECTPGGNGRGRVRTRACWKLLESRWSRFLVISDVEAEAEAGSGSAGSGYFLWKRKR